MLSVLDRRSAPRSISRRAQRRPARPALATCSGVTPLLPQPLRSGRARRPGNSSPDGIAVGTLIAGRAPQSDRSRCGPGFDRCVGCNGEKMFCQWSLAYLLAKRMGTLCTLRGNTTTSLAVASTTVIVAGTVLTPENIDARQSSGRKTIVPFAFAPAGNQRNFSDGLRSLLKASI